MFFYLFTSATNLWHQKFVTADVTAVIVNNQHGIWRRGQNFDKKFVFEGVHSEKVEKSRTKHGVNKLLKVAVHRHNWQLQAARQRQTTQ